MFYKETLIVFPWTTGYKQLSICENVRKGTFRIGQLMFHTKFQIPGLIVAKQFQADIFTIDGICLELKNKIAERTAHYTDGLVCGYEYVREVADLAIQALGYMQNSSCTMRIKHCDDVKCPAKKSFVSAKHDAALAKHDQFLTDYDKK